MSSTTNSFSSFASEIQTSTNTFPLRLTFGTTAISPLVQSLTLRVDGVMTAKTYIQGGPGVSIYSPAVRNITGNLKLPVRVTEGKELESIVKNLIDYTFFTSGNQCEPLAVRYFQVETGYFKTAQSYLVPPGVSDQNYNEDFILIKINRCVISSLTIEVSADSDMFIDVEFKGTIEKNDVTDYLFTTTSSITQVNSSFSNLRVLGLQDCRMLINNGATPNINQISFTITREIVEKVLRRSFNANYSPFFETVFILGNPVLNYSNDLPSKIGVKNFECKLMFKQVLRRIDEDLYFSRGGKGSAIDGTSTFFDVYFGPIHIARPCAMVLPSEQPFILSQVERQITISMLNRSKVVEQDFVSFITGGLW